MARKYKYLDQEKIYFFSFTVLGRSGCHDQSDSANTSKNYVNRSGERNYKT